MTQRSKLSTQDKLPEVKGKLIIVVREVAIDKVVKRVELENLVVNNFRTQILHSLAGNDQGNRYVSRIQVGTSGTDAAITDIAVTAPQDIAIVAMFPTVRSVQFDGTLAVADGNGATYQEAGLCLFNIAPNLLTRRTFDGIAKTAAFAWDLTWTLTWVT